MEFEFNIQKSVSNKAKHGIDFSHAQEIWNDPDVVEVPARVQDETRFLVIGKRADKIWSVVITYRHQRVRIISARRASKEEVDIYENA